MTAADRVPVRLRLLPTERGGLGAPMAGRRLWSVVFHVDDPSPTYDVEFAVVIDVGHELRPGEERRGRMCVFTVDAPPDWQAPGTRFDLWEGRTVGEGEVLGGTDVSSELS